MPGKTQPRNWVGADPCGGKWEGISCNNSRVTSITLAAVGLMGELSGDISSLSELEYLKLGGCSFYGPIPELIGSLQLLESLHLGRNRLSGTIPKELFRSDITLIHVLLHDNNLTGSIPSTLGLVHTLEAVRFEGNSLTGPVPSNLNNLTNVGDVVSIQKTTLPVKISQWILSNNNFTGPVPNLTGMASLSYLDLSNNSFDASDFPLSFSNLRALTTLMMENTGLEGQIPPTLFDLPGLQTLILRNNQLNGTLDIATSSSSQLKVIDMRNNRILFYSEAPERRNNVDVILVGNPVCEPPEATKNYCTVPRANYSYKRLPEKCVPLHCISDQISSPNCECSYPYRGVLVFKPPFLESRNSTYYVHLEEESLMRSFKSHQLPVDSVEVNFPAKDSFGYLESNLSMFPSGQNHFNTATISYIGFVLSLQTYENSDIFGPTYFKGSAYPYFDGTYTFHTQENPRYQKSYQALEGSLGLRLEEPLSCYYCFLQGYVLIVIRREEKEQVKQKNHFAYLDLKNSDSVPQLKGARCFSFDEITKCTNNFSEANHIGSGGYGMASLSLLSCPSMVYRGMLPTGQLIAIKRCRQGSVQGGHEFNAEIEVLSRVHHKCCKTLLGFAFERGEQMLIYEFVRNGSLRDSLSAEVSSSLDRKKDLYNLHELLDPSIRLDTMPKGLDKMVDLAMKYVQEKGRDRPTMGEVVKEIENILQLAGSNPDAIAESTSASFEEASQDEFPPSLKEEELSLS
uniref:Protein kinase domain-containing protein n=1 Tax=Populus alba TaxID=43335 RepID=A0A4U5PQ41_POPAL|nr:hypothetical protein D5086_0000192830 [Populus alba]